MTSYNGTKKIDVRTSLLGKILQEKPGGSADKI